MRPISFARFNALAGYARDFRTSRSAEELGWYQHADERVLGLLVMDRMDGDYAGIVFARDEQEQYRWTRMTEFVPTPRRAEALLRVALEQAALAPDEEHHQGHDNPKLVDFFTPVVSVERLAPNFTTLTEATGFSPARGIIEPMMRWFGDVDGNFIEQFQTTGFDARIWELYLFAMLSELRFGLDRSNPAPDFLAQSLRGRIAIEAVTVNPTHRNGQLVPSPPTDTPEQRHAFLREYMPIKFGSALYSKLNKAYWTKPHVQGLPFALAIQDFSARGSMTFTRSALEVYLYGFDHDWRIGDDGKLIVTPRRVVEHRWEGKVIPSGFFFLPGAENVSAVIFSNSGTISKFNRMGMVAGFGAPGIRMIRQGLAIDHDPDAAEPRGFTQRVDEAGYAETWVEGLTVFHNPQAVHPVNEALFPGAAHITLARDGRLLARTPDFHPLGSRTFISTDGKDPVFPGP